MNYLSRLTIYKFNKNKLKFDYSIIPIEEIESPNPGKVIRMKSSTSDEFIDFKIKKDYKDIYKDIVIKKGDDGSRVSRVLKVFDIEDSKTLEESETYINNTIYKIFNKHFWYKFKDKKILKKKVDLGQFKIQ